MTSLTAFLVLAALAFSTEARVTFRKEEYFADSGCSEADKKYEKYHQLDDEWNMERYKMARREKADQNCDQLDQNMTVGEDGNETSGDQNMMVGKDGNVPVGQAGCLEVNHTNSYYRKVSCYDSFEDDIWARVQYPVYTDDTCTNLSTAQGDTAATGKTTEQPVGVCSFEYGGTEGNWADTATSWKFTVIGRPGRDPTISGHPDPGFATVLYQEFATANCSGAATSESSHNTTDCFLKGGKYYKYALEEGSLHFRTPICSATEGKSLCWLVAAGVALLATMF